MPEDTNWMEMDGLLDMMPEDTDWTNIKYEN